MSTATAPLTYVERLAEHQRASGWTDAQMAEALGLSRPSWVLIRAGKRNFSFESLGRAMRRFPQYDAEALIFLRSNVTENNR